VRPLEGTTMTTTYRANCEGEDMGVFQPIRLETGALGYQGVSSRTGELLGILWSDGRYEEPGRNGNISWEVCAETPAHRAILEAASASWNECPMEFIRVES
jgi:hypothetical protein